MKIRNVEKEDIVFLLDLRNDVVVGQSAFNADPVDLETHRRWFNKKIVDKNAIILIIEDNDNRIGQIRFDIDKKSNVAEADIAIMPAYRRKGYGVKTLKIGCKYAFEKLHIEKIIAHIKPENEISIKTFAKAGFLNCGYVDHKTQKCVEMVLKSNSGFKVKVGMRVDGGAKCGNRTYSKMPRAE